MMNKKTRIKKGISIVLAMGLATGLVGCSTGNSSTEKPVASNAPAATPEPKKLAGSLVSEKPLDLTVHMHYGDRFAFDNNWAVFKKAGELTNVNLKGTGQSSGSKSGEMFNLMIASNEVPDIVHGFRETMKTYGPQGALMDLTDLINKNAPNLKKFMDKDPDYARYAKAADGKMYFVPYVFDGSGVSKGWLIRKDWLTKLGLQVPKTYQEYYNVLKAFKEKDPNGNGKADEVPYFSRDTSGIYDLLVFFDATYGGDLTLQWAESGGKLTYGPTQPQFKTAITNIAKWYKEGLIDIEIFTRGAKARDVLLGENKGGSTHDFFPSTLNFNRSLATQVPGFEMAVIAPPQNVNGKHVEATWQQKFGNHGFGIGAKNKYPVESIKYLDFWFSEEGTRLANFGVEGQSYTKENGQIKMSPEVMKGTPLENMYKFGAQHEFGYVQSLDFTKLVSTPESITAVEDYSKNQYMKKPFPILNYTAEEKKKFDTLSVAINTYVREMVQKWIMGADDIEKSYDGFMKKLKDMGVDEFTEVQQSAYSRYMK